jgi:hypothetical protein
MCTTSARVKRTIVSPSVCAAERRDLLGPDLDRVPVGLPVAAGAGWAWASAPAGASLHVMERAAAAAQLHTSMAFRSMRRTA